MWRVIPSSCSSQAFEVMSLRSGARDAPRHASSVTRSSRQYLILDTLNVPRRRARRFMMKKITGVMIST
jgi:hypothetical protein